MHWNLIPLLFFGCAGSSDDFCEDPPELLHLDACVVESGSLPTAYSASTALDRSLDGVVVEVGSGAPPEGCSAMEQWLLGETPAGEGWWFVMEDGEGTEWTVAALGLDDRAPLEAGEVIGVTWRWEAAEPFSGEPGGVELLVEDFEGALTAWVAGGRGLVEWDIHQDLSVQRGEELGRCEGDCITTVYYAAEIASGGDSASLDFGEAAKLGRFTALHGGTTEGEDATCSETAAHYSRMAAWR